MVKLQGEDKNHGTILYKRALHVRISDYQNEEGGGWCREIVYILKCLHSILMGSIPLERKINSIQTYTLFSINIKISR